MIHIPATLIAVDGCSPEKTVRAMRFTMRQATFEKAVLVVSPKTAVSPMDDIIVLRHEGVNSDRSMRLMREEFLIFKLWTAFETERCLHMEWDAGIINPGAWNPKWLEYDFIGAPWLSGTLGLYLVGGMGFSMITRRFLKAASEIAKPTPEEAIASDWYICHTLGPELADEYGMKFAPTNEAAVFSCESKIYVGQFGLHGKRTAIENGWDPETMFL